MLQQQLNAKLDVWKVNVTNFVTHVVSCLCVIQRWC